MVDVNIPREQACTQHNALNTQRNMRSGQSGWAKHTQHSSIRKPNMASTGFYLFLFLFLLSAWKNRSEMMHGEQQMYVDKLKAYQLAGRWPAIAQSCSTLHREHDTMELLFQFQPTASHCNSQDVLHHSVFGLRFPKETGAWLCRPRWQTKYPWNGTKVTPMNYNHWT